MNSPSEARIIAIFGPPGAGKTTVARALAAQLGAAYVSSGDIAREVDPGALARGEMADQGVLRKAFKKILKKQSGRVIVDGLPRYPTDVELLPPPPETLFILLNVLPGIAYERQMRRGRVGDEPDIIKRRTDEQRELMELDKPEGWPFVLAGWRQALLTDRHTADYVIHLVSEYVAGRRSSVG